MKSNIVDLRKTCFKNLLRHVHIVAYGKQKYILILIILIEFLTLSLEYLIGHFVRKQQCRAGEWTRIKEKRKKGKIQNTLSRRKERVPVEYNVRTVL